MASLQRFLKSVTFTKNGCWTWKGTLYQGYGRFGSIAAHRWLYQRLHGPLSKNLVLDHLCRNRSCVNPLHLEPVSNVENIRRGLSGEFAAHARQVQKCLKAKHE